MDTTPYWKSAGFTAMIVVYLILGVITAFLCYKESRKQKNYTYEWVMLGYIFPVISFLLLKGKRQ